MKLKFGPVLLSILLTGAYACHTESSQPESEIKSEVADSVPADERQIGESVDCSDAFGKPSTCVVIECDEKYKTFIGAWKGPFLSYVRELSTEDKSVFRPYDNTVTYSKSDCLKNTETEDSFIIGRRTDKYPEFETLAAMEKTGLLITGKKKDGSPFLRTVDDEGLNDYTMVYKNPPANMSIWELIIPASDNNPEMRFATIDGQDWNESGVHKRNVTVTMSLGPKDSPMWEGVIVKGYHSLQK